MNPWLAIIGLGEDGISGLSPQARTLIAGAALLVGGERHLALVPEGGAERRTWATPLSRSRRRIATSRVGQRKRRSSRNSDRLSVVSRPNSRLFSITRAQRPACDISGRISVRLA